MPGCARWRPKPPIPAAYRVLDIGAGTGRNALALARRGHSVDVVELTAKFAEMIRSDAARESLDVRVIQRDAFSTMADLRRDYQLVLLSEVVSDFRTKRGAAQDVRAGHPLPCPRWAVGVQRFLGARSPTYRMTLRVNSASKCYSSIFTRDEMSSAAAKLPLELVADDSVYEYEKAHLPDGAWPPTSWYAGWVIGLDVFDVEREQCPIEMRWLVYQRVR